MAESTRHQVIITRSARVRYRISILPYLSKNFTPRRVEEIENAIAKTIESLSQFPRRGTLEATLSDRPQQVRYILLRETRFFELKIIYFVHENSQSVYITDFFPTTMHPKGIGQPDL